jgi:hypothetical protein
MSPTKAWFSLEPHQRFKELLDAAALQIQEREEANRAGTPEELDLMIDREAAPATTVRGAGNVR